MPDLNDVLNKAVASGFYTSRDFPGLFIHFTGFGSIRFPAQLYNPEGKLIGTRDLRIDSLRVRREYTLVPEDQLPEPLRELFTERKFTKA